MTAKEARRSDRFTQLAVVAAEQAVAEAGLPDGIEPERFGVLMGSAVGGLESVERECKNWLEEGDRGVSPLFVTMMMPNAAAGTIAIRLNAQGPGFSIASACATGAHAIGEAARMIARGEADVSSRAAPRRAERPDHRGLQVAGRAVAGAGISRPFDARRDGFVMGEGAGVLVLESEEHARARGARDPRRASPATAPPTTPSTSPSPTARAAAPPRRCAARCATPARPRPTSATSTRTAPPRRTTTASRRWRCTTSSTAARRRCPRPSRPSGTCSAPPARSRRWRSLGRDRARPAAADDQLRGARPRLRPRLRARRAARGAGPEARAVELVRVRRPERLSGDRAA